MDSKEGVIDLYQNLRLRFPNLPENVKDKQVDILFRIINNKHMWQIINIFYSYTNVRIGK